jgi:hypothetical protein
LFHFFVVPDYHLSVPSIRKFAALRFIIYLSPRLIVIGTVAEDANTWNTPALVIKVRFCEYVRHGAILGPVRQPASGVMQEPEEVTFQLRILVTALFEPRVVLVVRSARSLLGGSAASESDQVLANEMVVDG